MHPISFQSEVSHQIKSGKLPRENNHLNLRALRHYENEGIEIAKFVMRNGLIGASIASPLEKLLKKGTLTHSEFAVATRYSRDVEIASVTNHARPIYDGTPISSASTNQKSKTPPSSQLFAASKVAKIRAEIAKQSEPKQFKDFGKKPDPKRTYRTMTRDKRYSDILALIFEREVSIRAAEAKLGLNHRVIEERTKEICEIILKFY
jgi:anti-sigma28 factor (negative regulator of flagellin synthesis)